MLFKCSGKYIDIYFSFKITYFFVFFIISLTFKVYTQNFCCLYLIVFFLFFIDLSHLKFKNWCRTILKNYCLIFM